MGPPRDFVALVLSHGRASSVTTVRALRKSGYTGPIVLVVDDEDPQLEDYRKTFDRVEVFSKAEVAIRTPLADNLSGPMGVIVFARNACQGIAARLGYRDYLQLDDDYTRFFYKTGGEGEYREEIIWDLDGVFCAMQTFFRSVPQLKCLAMLQNGDFIGGPESGLGKKIVLARKAMNSLLCSVDRPFTFQGRINEDVTTYVHLGAQGDLFFSTSLLSLLHTPTQQRAGGMTQAYLDGGTYTKSFYTVIHQPSSVKVGLIQSKNPRIHHHIDWGRAVPKIVSESLRKPMEATEGND